MSDFPWDLIGIIICCWVASHFAEKDGFKSGYIQALYDLKNNKPAKYVVEVKENGETKWIENKEKK
jgi:hypothetical protein